MWVAPCGHSCQLNAILNDVVQLAIRKTLADRIPKVGYAWVEIPAHLRFPRSIKTMTVGAFVQEQFVALADCVGIVCERILRVTLSCWNREAPNPKGDP